MPPSTTLHQQRSSLPLKTVRFFICEYPFPKYVQTHTHTPPGDFNENPERSTSALGDQLVPCYIKHCLHDHSSLLTYTLLTTCVVLLQNQLLIFIPPPNSTSLFSGLPSPPRYLHHCKQTSSPLTHRKNLLTSCCTSHYSHIQSSSPVGFTFGKSVSFPRSLLSLQCSSPPSYALGLLGWSLDQLLFFCSSFPTIHPPHKFG